MTLDIWRNCVVDSKGSQKVTPGLECSIDISCLSFGFLEILWICIYIYIYIVSIFVIFVGRGD